MENVLRALSDPRRREILRLVSDRERSAGEIASNFDVTRPAISQHLGVLKDAGLLTERREGTKRLYLARPEGVGEVREFLDRFWGDNLERLKLAAEHEQRRRNARHPTAVEREIRIGATPDTVFDFLVDSEKMPIWMGRRAELDPRAGGVVRVEINDQASASGEFVVVERPKRVVFTWGWEGGVFAPNPGTSTVEITLTADGDGTVVKLVHTDLPEPARDPHAHGWEQYLERLGKAAVGADPGPDPNAC